MLLASRRDRSSDVPTVGQSPLNRPARSVTVNGDGAA